MYVIFHNVNTNANLYVLVIIAAGSSSFVFLRSRREQKYCTNLTNQINFEQSRGSSFHEVLA